MVIFGFWGLCVKNWTRCFIKEKFFTISKKFDNQLAKYKSLTVTQQSRLRQPNSLRRIFIVLISNFRPKLTPGLNEETCCQKHLLRTHVSPMFPSFCHTQFCMTVYSFTDLLTQLSFTWHKGFLVLPGL